MISIIWDLEDDPGGNYQHILAHEVTPDEVEEVLHELRNPTGASASTGRPITFGWTRSGRHIAVVWELIPGEPSSVYPVTAYEVSSLGRRKGHS
jgi:hypothetical protein